MSMNDAECRTQARKLGGSLGAAIFAALWLLGETGIGAALVAGVISALILARTACYVMGCLPEKVAMSAGEAAALRHPAPAAPVAATPVAAAAPVAPAAKPAVMATAVAAPAPVAVVASAPAKSAVPPASAPAPAGGRRGKGPKR